MNKNFMGDFDEIMLHNAQIALHRLYSGYSAEWVDWEPIRGFRDVFSKMCDSNDSEMQTLLKMTISQSRRGHPGRRRTDAMFPTPKQVLGEIDLLINNKPFIDRTRAERLYEFCHFFIKCMGEKHTPSPTLQAASA